MKIKNEHLINFLKDGSWESKKTIEKLLDTELQKEPEEMDMEFIDACMYYLADENEETIGKKGKVSHRNRRVIFGKLLAAVLAVMLCFLTSITVYAGVNSISITDAFVKIFSDHATVIYSDKEIIEAESNNIDNNSLYNKIEDFGIKNVMLPFDLYNMDYDIEYSEKTPSKKSMKLHFTENEITVKINDYARKKYVEDAEIKGDFSATKQIQVNHIDVYFFEKDGVTTIVSYQIGLTQYYISFEGNIQNAEQFFMKNRDYTNQ